jgi:hypothetical protein
MARSYELGGLPVTISATDSARWDAITGLLGGLRPWPGTAAVRIRYCGRRPGLPRRRPDHTYEDMRVWHDAERLVLQYATDARASVTADDAWLGGGVEDLDVAFQRLFHFAATHLLAHHDRVALHAAAVARDGDAYLALGDSGAGKSTLAVAALRDGWQVLGDDLVVVRTGEGGVLATGVARPPHVPHEMATGWIADDRSRDQRGRVPLPVASLTPGWFPVAGIISLAHAEDVDGALTTLHRDETMIRLISAFASATDGALLRRAFPVLAGLSRLPSWQLAHGSDAGTRLVTCQRLLSDVARPSVRRA